MPEPLLTSTKSTVNMLVLSFLENIIHFKLFEKTTRIAWSSDMPESQMTCSKIIIKLNQHHILLSDLSQLITIHTTATNQT